jgi:hypothetical protein
MSRFEGLWGGGKLWCRSREDIDYNTILRISRPDSVSTGIAL